MSSIRLNHAALKSVTNQEAVGLIKGAANFHLPLPGLMAASCKNAMPGVVYTDGRKTLEMNEDRAKSFLGQKYSMAGDTPILQAAVTRTVEFFHEGLLELDMGWMELFDTVDMTNSTNTSFEIMTGSMAFKWEQRHAGDKTPVRRKISEGKQSVEFIEYSDGLGLLDQYLQFQQFYKMEEAMGNFRNSFYTTKADRHYNLITALKGSVTFNVSGFSDDVAIMNQAYGYMMRSLDGLGIVQTTNAPVAIMCAPEDLGRVQKTLSARVGSAIVSEGTVSGPNTARVSSIITTNRVGASEGGYYMIVPKGKLKTGNWKELTTENKRDVYTSANDVVGVAQYNCAAAEAKQVLFVPFK